jgi:hypothetical protein
MSFIEQASQLVRQFKGNLFLIKKCLFFSAMSGYNINVGDRMFPETGKMPKRRGEPCRRLPFFIPFFLPSTLK